MFGLDKMFGGGAAEESSNPFKSILGTLGSGISAGFTGNLVDSMFGKDPADEALDMMDTLYPGTTPYERLSNGANTSSAGALESLSQKSLNAQINANKRAADIQTKQVDTQRKNVQDTNKANIVSELIRAGKIGPVNPRGANSAVDEYLIEMGLNPLGNRDDKDPGQDDKPKKKNRIMGMPMVSPQELSRGFTTGVPQMTNDVLKWFD